MSPLTLFIAGSLDGYIASADGTVGWLFHDADYGYTEFLASLDAVVLGRKTYEQALTFEATPYPGKRIYVFSRSTPASPDERIRFVQGDATNVVDRIRSETKRGIWLVGGSELIQQFLARDLIDAYRLFVHPIILGAGIPLFLPQPQMSSLMFVGSNAFPSGLLEVRYQRKQAEQVSK